GRCWNGCVGRRCRPERDERGQRTRGDGAGNRGRHSPGVLGGRGRGGLSPARRRRDRGHPGPRAGSSADRGHRAGRSGPPRGAHVNISGVSGVATKTTYALFLLYALFHSEVLGRSGVNTKAIVFNVKGEDLMWLDTPNRRLSERDRAEYDLLGLPAGAFESV